MVDQNMGRVPHRVVVIQLQKFLHKSRNGGIHSCNKSTVVIVLFGIIFRIQMDVVVVAAVVVATAAVVVAAVVVSVVAAAAAAAVAVVTAAASADHHSSPFLPRWYGDVVAAVEVGTQRHIVFLFFYPYPHLLFLCFFFFHIRI